MEQSGDCRLASIRPPMTGDPQRRNSREREWTRSLNQSAPDSRCPRPSHCSSNAYSTAGSTGLVTKSFIPAARQA